MPEFLSRGDASTARQNAAPDAPQRRTFAAPPTATWQNGGHAAILECDPCDEDYTLPACSAALGRAVTARREERRREIASIVQSSRRELLLRDEVCSPPTLCGCTLCGCPNRVWLRVGRPLVWALSPLGFRHQPPSCPSNLVPCRRRGTPLTRGQHCTQHPRCPRRCTTASQAPVPATASRFDCHLHPAIFFQRGRGGRRHKHSHIVGSCACFPHTSRKHF